MRIIRLSFVSLSVLLFAVSSAGASTTKSHKDGSKGVSQMAGGTGKFGVTYTLTDNNGLLINYTILSAAYKIEPCWCAPSGAYAPNSTQKVLEVHYKVKNPQSTDEYFNGSDYIQVIDQLDETLTTHDGTGRNVITDDNAAATLKPGQGIADIVTYALVPAKGPESKLILTLGRAGVNEKILRFPLGTAPNIVTPLPAPYADPTDPSGTTAAAEVPATFGTVYVAGFYGLTVSSPTFASGALGRITPDDGKKLLTVLVTLKDITEAQQYCNGALQASVTDPDGDSLTMVGNLKAEHDDNWDGRMLDPAETTSFRAVFEVPTDETLQTLKIATPIDNTGDYSQTFVYDVSGVK